jgi:anti-sigma factor RsiW
MTNGYHDHADDDFSDLDEWLCEYVDGTIDPAARGALEECMRSNPALARHVESLLQARNLLCRYGCRHQAPHSLQPKLQERLARESEEALPPTPLLAGRLGRWATYSSLIALAVLFGNLHQQRRTEWPTRGLHPAVSATRTPRWTPRNGVITAAPLASFPSGPTYASLDLTGSRYPQVPAALFPASGTPTRQPASPAPATPSALYP